MIQHLFTMHEALGSIPSTYSHFSLLTRSCSVVQASLALIVSLPSAVISYVPLYSAQFMVFISIY